MNIPNRSRVTSLPMLAALVASFLISMGLKASDQEGVIIEKPNHADYQIVSTAGNLGMPTLPKVSNMLSIKSFAKEFTNVEDPEANVASRFVGVDYSLSYNQSWFSYAATLGFAAGKKTKDIPGESSSEGLADSLKNQFLGELSARLYVNLLEKIWLRPFVGAGAYKLIYKYDSDGDEKVETFNIGTSFLRYGVSLNLSKLDSSAVEPLWNEFGISRVSLELEWKKYNPVNSENIAKYESSLGLSFEF